MKVETLISAIATALKAEWNYPVYTERVESCARTPCFFVRSFRNKNNQELNGRFRHMVDLEVVFFPTETEIMNGRRQREEMNNVSDRLMYLLRIIEVDGRKLLATDLESTVSDDTLVFTFSVTITERIEKETAIMETHQTDIKVMLTEHTHIKDKDDGSKKEGS